MCTMCFLNIRLEDLFIMINIIIYLSIVQINVIVMEMRSRNDNNITGVTLSCNRNCVQDLMFLKGIKIMLFPI